jgi:hypothetical protein
MGHPVSRGQIQGPGPPGWGLDARLKTLFCKKKLSFRNPKSENWLVEFKTSLTESYNEGYDLKIHSTDFSAFIICHPELVQ